MPSGRGNNKNIRNEALANAKNVAWKAVGAKGSSAGVGWGAAHHAGIAAGGGAGGGFFAGKACGLKLGLGLGGLGGPFLLAAVAGTGSYALYKILQKPKHDKTGTT